MRGDTLSAAASELEDVPNNVWQQGLPVPGLTDTGAGGVLEGGKASASVDIGGDECLQPVAPVRTPLVSTGDALLFFGRGTMLKKYGSTALFINAGSVEASPAAHVVAISYMSVSKRSLASSCVGSVPVGSWGWLNRKRSRSEHR